MIVLAESNLVLELAFQQEQSGEVEDLVTLTEARQVGASARHALRPACILSPLQ
jgi:hypothetical protein